LCFNINIALDPEYEVIRKDLKAKLDYRAKKARRPQRVWGMRDVFEATRVMSTTRELSFHERGEYNPALYSKRDRFKIKIREKLCFFYDTELIMSWAVDH